MPQTDIQAQLLRPRLPDGETTWAFVVLPKEVSEQLPRRGRTSVDGRLNGHPFQARLEPDGQLSHRKRGRIEKGDGFICSPIQPAEKINLSRMALT